MSNCFFSSGQDEPYASILFNSRIEPVRKIGRRVWRLHLLDSSRSFELWRRVYIRLQRFARAQVPVPVRAAPGTIKLRKPLCAQFNGQASSRSAEPLVRAKLVGDKSLPQRKFRSLHFLT